MKKNKFQFTILKEVLICKLIIIIIKQVQNYKEKEMIFKNLKKIN